METKIFGGKKIKIRESSRKDLRNAKKFQDFINFINSLIEEDTQILMNKKVSLKEERKWLEKEIRL